MTLSLSEQIKSSVYPVQMDRPIVSMHREINTHTWTRWDSLISTVSYKVNCSTGTPHLKVKVALNLQQGNSKEEPPHHNTKESSCWPFPLHWFYICVYTTIFNLIQGLIDILTTQHCDLSLWALYSLSCSLTSSTQKANKDMPTDYNGPLINALSITFEK